MVWSTISTFARLTEGGGLKLFGQCPYGHISNQHISKRGFPKSVANNSDIKVNILMTYLLDKSDHIEDFFGACPVIRSPEARHRDLMCLN